MQMYRGLVFPFGLNECTGLFELEPLQKKKRLKIVVTGATGFVARQIVPILEEHADLVLISRDEQAAQNLYPEHVVSSYKDAWKLAEGADSLLHLAAVNNNKTSTLEESRKVNVEWFKKIVEEARSAKVSLLIYISTIHTLQSELATPYAITKQEAETWLEDTGGIPSKTFLLPSVYSEKFSGRLAILNRVPKVFRPIALKAVSAMIPTISAQSLASKIIQVTDTKATGRETLCEDQANNWLFRWTKRVIDIAFVVIIALVFWWLMLAIWILIKVTSKGPGIFAQKRVGQNKDEFICFKFRTMHAGTAQTGTHEMPSTAITPVGHILRRFKLDELPQIWNIIRGELSLVGPRPCLPVQQALIEERENAGIFEVKPGVTGLAQISGVDMSNPGKLACWDRRYVDLQSILLDIKIIFATALGRGRGDRVKKN